MTPKYRFIHGQIPQVEQRMNDMYYRGWRYVKMVSSSENAVTVLMIKQWEKGDDEPQVHETTKTMRNMLEPQTWGDPSTSGDVPDY